MIRFDSCFDWGAATLLRSEQYRGLSPRRLDPTKSIEENERTWLFDSAHRATERENALDALHAEYAASLGLMVSVAPCTLAALISNSKNKEDQAPLPPWVALMEAKTVATVWMRSGPGARVHNAAVLHTALPRQEVSKACAELTRIGCRCEILPFSFVNSRALLAVLIRRGPGEPQP